MIKKETFIIQGMHCAACAVTIEKALKKVPGVKSASVSLMSEKAMVEYEEPATPEILKNAVAGTGYKLISEGEHPPASAFGAADGGHGDHHKMLKEAEIKILKNKFIIGAILSVLIIVLSFPDYLPVFGEIMPDTWRFFLLFILTIPVEFLIGWQFWRGAWFGLKNFFRHPSVLKKINRVQADIIMFFVQNRI